MKLKPVSGPWVIVITFIVAFALAILPLPHWATWVAPQWVILVMIYWALALPHRVSVGVAWSLGIIMDVINGTLLGQHALAAVVVAYLATKFHNQIRVFPLAQQALSVLIMILLYQSILLWVQGVTGHNVQAWWLLLSPVTSMLLWPWMFTVLRGCRRRFKVE